MAFDISNLPSELAEYSNATRPELLAKVVNEGTTIELVSLQPGVKYKEPIHTLDVDIDVQEGFNCVSTPQGTASFDSTRDLEVCRRTAHDSVCMATLEKTYQGVQLSAGSTYNATEAVMGKIMDGVVNKYQKNTEMFLWDVAGTNACGVDGLYTHVSSSTAGVVAVSQSALTTANAIDIVDEFVMELSDDILDRDDLTIFMSMANLKKYKKALRDANYFHAGDVRELTSGNVQAIQHPYENVKIVGTIGLGSSNRIIAGPAKQIVVGTDLASDATNFQLWYDINADAVKYRLSSKFGANIVFPEYWVSNDLA